MQINPYKYNIAYGKKNSYELNITLNNNVTNVTILKFKKIKGSNKNVYINTIKNIIKEVYEQKFFITLN